MCNIYYQLFSLLTILLSFSCSFFTCSDYDPSGFIQMESDGSNTIYDAILAILTFKPSSNHKLVTIVEQMKSSTGGS